MADSSELQTDVHLSSIVDARGDRTLTEIVTAAGSRVTTVRICEALVVDADLVIPPTLTLHFVGRGCLRIHKGRCVTIHSHLCGRRQIFEYPEYSPSEEEDAVVIVGAPGPIEPSTSGRVVYHGRDIYPEWWGARGDDAPESIGLNDLALHAAIAAVPIDGSSLANGAVVHLRGRYRYSRGLVVRGRINLTIQGRGARYANNYAHSPTALVYQSAAGHALAVVGGNASRNFSLERLGVHYTHPHFDGDLVLVNTVGFQAIDCAFGGDGVSAATALYSANSCIALRVVESIVLRHCALTEARRGVWVPQYINPATNAPGLQANHVVITECHFSDFDRAAIEQEQDEHGVIIAAANWTITGNGFNPIRNKATTAHDPRTFGRAPFGIKLRVRGYTISNNGFGASTMLHSPTDASVVLQGVGVFSGNWIATNYVGVRVTEGTHTIEGNFIVSPVPLELVRGLVRGGGNHYQLTSGRDFVSGDVLPSTAGVLIAPERVGGLTLDIGPDVFEAGPEARVSYKYAPRDTNLNRRFFAGHINYMAVSDGTRDKHDLGDSRYAIARLDPE